MTGRGSLIEDIPHEALNFVVSLGRVCEIAGGGQTNLGEGGVPNKSQILEALGGDEVGD